MICIGFEVPLNFSRSMNVTKEELNHLNCSEVGTTIMPNDNDRMKDLEKDNLKPVVSKDYELDPSTFEPTGHSLSVKCYSRKETVSLP